MFAQVVIMVMMQCCPSTFIFAADFLNPKKEDKMKKISKHLFLISRIGFMQNYYFILFLAMSMMD